MRYFFCGSFVFHVSCVPQTVHCCLVVTCWERAELLSTWLLLALVGDVYCIFVTFPCGILGQVWYLIVSFPDLCCLSYFIFLLFLNQNICCGYSKQMLRLIDKEVYSQDKKPLNGYIGKQ